MAARRGRRTAESKRREAGALVVALLLLVVVFWSVVWPYAAAVLLVGGLGAVAWWLWRTDRMARGRDREWREHEEVRAGHRTLGEVDAMTGTAFEEHVAGLCRRDGCTEVRRVGGAGDQGADVIGRLPDGRSMVVQCKRYAPSGTIASRELRGLLGSRVHFGADVAIFVTTTRFSRPSAAFAATHSIATVHRDHLGLWNSGTPLDSILDVSAAGQGDGRHRARWKRTYG